MTETIQSWTPETRTPFVYGLVDPAEPTHIRYVGMAPVKAGRPYEHAKEARLSSSQTYKLNWIRKIQRLGREPAVVVLEELSENASPRFAGFVETCYIKSLREIGHRLTNVSEGGNGGNLGAESNARISAARMGHEVTESTRILLREAGLGNQNALGYKHTPEGIAKLVTLQADPERRKAASVRMQGNTHGAGSRSAETCANISAAKMGHSTPPHVLALLDRTGTTHSEETRLAMSEAHTRYYENPENRKAQSERLKASWARRKAAKNGD